MNDSDFGDVFEAGLSTDSMPSADAVKVTLAHASGGRTMLRKLFVPMLATAMLAGCATDYNYRGGSGDYYYGQPRVEYRYQGSGGYYGGYYGGAYGSPYRGFGLGYGLGGYGYGATYFYDPFGRLVYGYPSRYRYGHDGYRSRPHHDHDRGPRDDVGDRDGDNREDRRPPWRNFGGLQPGGENNVNRQDDDRRPRMDRRQPVSTSMPAPRVQQQSIMREAPVMRERSQPSPRSGGFSGAGGERTKGRRSDGSDE